MDFMEAVKAMKEGKKVMYNKTFFIYLEDNEIYHSQDNEPLNLSSLNNFILEKRNWKIYEEKCINCGSLMNLKNHTCKCKEDNWNLADNVFDRRGQRVYKEIVIKTFIQKVRGDCIEFKDKYDTNLLPRDVDKIIDKRAGNL